MMDSLARCAPHATTLEGILERVSFINEENAWSVVKLDVPGKQDLVTAVGNLLGVQPGERSSSPARGCWRPRAPCWR